MWKGQKKIEPKEKKNLYEIQTNKQTNQNLAKMNTYIFVRS